MRRIDFISGAPQLSIFKEGAYKTNLGVALFLINIIVFIVLFVFYFVDYFLNDKYQFNYTLFQNEGFNKGSQDVEISSKLNPDLDYVFYLFKDGYNISNNTNFVIIDMNLLNHVRKKDEDGFVILNSSNIYNEDEWIIQQGKIKRENQDIYH